MTIVIDANALVALIASEPDGPAVSELIERWTAEERELHAPALARYEIANVLTRQHAAGRLSTEDIKSGWEALEELPIAYHALLDGPLARNAAGQKLPVRLIDGQDREDQETPASDMPASEPSDQERSQPT